MSRGCDHRDHKFTNWKFNCGTDLSRIHHYGVGQYVGQVTGETHSSQIYHYVVDWQVGDVPARSGVAGVHRRAIGVARRATAWQGVPKRGKACIGVPLACIGMSEVLLAYKSVLSVML